MADIAPELYSKIKESFDRKFAQAQLLGESLGEVMSRINSGDATSRDADLFAVEVGSMMADAMKEHLILEELPGKTLYRNIAQRTIGEGLKDTYGIVSNVARTIQEEINAAQKIGLKAVQPKLETKRVDDIVTKAVNASTQEALDKVIKNNVPTFSRQVVDDTQKTNARLHHKAGLNVKIEREYDGVGLHDGEDVCEFCLERAGTWTYEKALDNGVFQRHEGCGCIIVYTSAKGKTTIGSGAYLGSKEGKGVTTTGWNWEEGRREELVEKAKNKIAETQIKAEERRRERLLTLGSSRNFQRMHDSFSAKKLEHFTLNNLYIADDVGLKPREIRRINKQITQAKELLSLTDECKAPIVIVNDKNTLAAYNPVSNTFFVSASMADSYKISELQQTFVCSSDERSTMVHELFHWRDAEDYRLSGKIIDDASEKSEYSIFQSEKAYNELIAANVDLKDINKISQEISIYAGEMCLENNYEEVYTEFRTLLTIGAG